MICPLVNGFVLVRRQAGVSQRGIRLELDSCIGVETTLDRMMLTHCKDVTIFDPSPNGDRRSAQQRVGHSGVYGSIRKKGLTTE